MEDGTPPGNDDDPPSNHRLDQDKTAEDKTTEAENILHNPPKTSARSPVHASKLPIPSSPNGRKYHAMYENMRDRYGALKTKYDDEKVETEKILNEKEKVIKELNDCLQAANNRLAEATPALMKMNNDDIFIIKPKKSIKTASKPFTETCAISGCENTNIDLIKCNLCGNPVCEDCSSVKFAKLRPVMNQCSTLYFTCKCCDVLMGEKDVDVYDQMKTQISTLKEELECCEQQNSKLSSDANESQKVRKACDRLTDENKAHAVKIDELQKTIMQKNQEHSGCKGQINNLSQKIKTLTDHQETLRLLLEERENSLHDTEAKLVSLEHGSNTNQASDAAVNIEELINKRFDKIEKSVDELISNKFKENHKAVAEIGEKINGTITTSTKTFSDTVKGNITANTLSTAFRERKNDEMVQERERDKRSANLVIYGVSEVCTGELKDHDDQFISSFMDIIGVTVRPKEITRLGKPNEDKKRPLKLVMGCDDDKNTVMSRLSNLKNADEIYRKLSVREDYTIEEREQVREWVKKAAAKNTEENTDCWKVRGTPKNGLRLVKITKRS